LEENARWLEYGVGGLLYQLKSRRWLVAWGNAVRDDTRSAAETGLQALPHLGQEETPVDGGEIGPLATESQQATHLEHLTSVLAGRYVVQRELGQGGMATVYLAHDRKHDRQVALKVLRPDIAAVLGSDRFKREIKLAAGLSHPNIMPVHDSGDADGFLYYVMPHIDGLSLRDRLNQDGRLPVNEALRIVRAVAEALGHAHRHGVVHRDIKPENIMLHEGHPLVADFGIGKAMSTAGDVGLTLSGIAVGTPAYMSPEQAAGDEDIDGRSDLYSLGCVLFEMLTGEQPFTGPTAQVVIAKRFVQRPANVTELCNGIGPAVEYVVQRALARDPKDRFETASLFAAAVGELVDTETYRVFSTIGPHGSDGVWEGPRNNGNQPDAGVLPAVPMQRTGELRLGAPERAVDLSPSRTDEERRRGRTKRPVVALARAGTLFGLAAVGVLSIVRYLVTSFGLPDWVLPGAIIWLVAGVPVLLLTGRQEFKRIVALSGGTLATTAVGVRRHLTWRKAVLGGAVGLGALAVLTVLYMAMRLVGVGPLGTLMATGAFQEGGGIVVAEFTNRTDEPDLGAAVTEALRVDLAQSPVVSPVSPTAVRDALARMGLTAATPVDRRIATEIAVRDGIPVVVAGEVLSLGEGFVLSARVINSVDDQELLALRETADNGSEVIAAVERLSHRLRERIGESLKDIRRSPALSSVTTASLPALRRFSLGVQLIGEGRWSQANEVLTDAVHLDSTFAEAYVRLGYNLSNQDRPRSSVVEAMSAAFRHRDRLPESRQNSVEGAYYSIVGEPEKSAAAYEASLASGDRSALNNLSLQYLALRQPEKAVDILTEARERNTNTGLLTVNFTRALFSLGRVEEAQQVWDNFVSANPGYQLSARHTARLAVARDSFQAARTALAEAGQSEDLFATAIVSRYGAFLSAAQGKLSDALQVLETQMAAAAAAGDRAGAFALEVKSAEVLAGNGRSADYVLRLLDGAEERHGAATLAALDRFLPTRARLRAKLGDVDEARRLLREHEEEVLADYPNIDMQERLLATAELELAEGKVLDAMVTFRIADIGRCVICALPGLARAYEAAGEVDSAAVTYERYLSIPFADRIDHVAIDHAFVLKRLGELHESGGNRETALEYYNRFIELWRDADPELQLFVDEARERIIELIQ
jgi:tetratricopeptide (TPR) repeat protein/tRNA A-37 threonylcarbamoyl transferase component Bud32